MEEEKNELYEKHAERIIKELEYLLKCHKDEAEYWMCEYSERMYLVDPENETGWEDTFNEEKKAFKDKRRAQ